MSGSDNALAAVISFSPLALIMLYGYGFRRGAKRQLKLSQERINAYAAKRSERWTQATYVPFGDPGTNQRLLSDYEDAIFRSVRHSYQAAGGLDGEGHHVIAARELHAEVRRLRGEVLLEMDESSDPAALP